MVDVLWSGSISSELYDLLLSLNLPEDVLAEILGGNALRLAPVGVSLGYLRSALPRPPLLPSLASDRSKKVG